MAQMRAPDGEMVEVPESDVAHYQSLGATLVAANPAEARIAAPAGPVPGSREDLIAQLNAPHEDFQGMGMPPLGALVGLGATAAEAAAPAMASRVGGLVGRAATATGKTVLDMAREVPVVGKAMNWLGHFKGAAGKAAAAVEGKGLAAAESRSLGEATSKAAYEAPAKTAAARRTSGKIAGEIKPGNPAEARIAPKPKPRPSRPMQGKSRPALERQSAARAQATGKNPPDPGLTGLEDMDTALKLEQHFTELGLGPQERVMARMILRQGGSLEDISQLARSVLGGP